MARQVLPIVGAVVGAYFGYPQAGFMIGSILGQVLDPAVAQGPQLGELPVQTSNEGMPRAIIYGTATCTGYILAFGDPIKTWEAQETGGKGSSSSSEPNTIYRCYAVAICEAPAEGIKGLLRVWENDKLVYDVRPGSAMLAESAKWMANKFFHNGAEDQVPNVFMEQTISGVGTTPAYRGTAYMYFNLEDLTDTAGAIKQYRWEVSTTVAASTPAAEWYESVAFTGTASSVALATLDLSAGGLVWVSRLDAVEAPKMFYQVADSGVVYEMGNSTVLGPTPDNPIASTAVFASYGAVLPPFTSGGSYIAYVFQQSDGNFQILNYTGNGTAGNTIAHTLGSAPKMHFVRQRDDPTYTLSFAHLQHFAGTAFLLMGSVNNVSTSSQQWNNTAPTSGYVTLGNHPQINGSGRQYVMFLFGGDDCYASADTSGTTLSVGFDPAFAFIKRRSSTASNYYLTTGSGQDGFAGNELLAYGNPSASTSIVEERILRLSGGVYEVSTAPGASGTWVTDVVDTFMIKGATTPPATTLTLGDIVSDLSDRSTLVAGDDFDVSELTDLVTGLTLTGDYTAGDAINTLRSCYFFDKAEPGDKLYFPKRGKPVVMTLDFDDLVDVPDLSKREQVGEVPKKLHLMYQHPTAGYAPVKATFERSSVDVQSVVETTMQVPVVLDENEARQMVHKQMKVMAAEAQGEIKLTLPERLIGLIPSDNIGLSLRGQVRRLRIDERDWADGVLSDTLRIDRQSAYTSNLTGISIPEPALPPSTIVGETTFVFADVPSRSDSEDDLHYLVAGVGALPGWYGWQLQRSLDAGANYSNVEQFTAADVIGTLVDAVPSASDHYTDTSNTVRVQLYNSNHTLEDLTDAQFLSEGGAFLLEKADGSYEVLQYRDATDEGSGIFALTHLHRGRLNSGASAHVAGARFVLLSSAHHVPAQSAWIGQSVTHRPVSLGESPESATAQSNTYAGRSQLEWAPASLVLARSVANIVTGSWAPRHRFGTDDAPVASVNFQGYRVTIVGSSTVTFDQTSNLLSYDASALGASVVVSVQALNRITGAGPATSGTI